MLPPTVVAELTVLVALLFSSAFFAMSETAFIGVNRVEVRRRAQEGSAKAARVDRMLNAPERILSTVLVGNTIINISAAALATVIAEQVFTQFHTVIATVVITLVVLILCEIAPKTLAVQHPLRYAMHLASALALVEVILRPVIVVAEVTGKAIVRPFGVKAKGPAPYITPDEIEMLVRLGVESGDVAKFEAKVIQELFDFTETDVQKVMVPREQVHFLPKEASLAAAAEMAAKEGRTRILVVDGDFDHVLGCVHGRDLLRFTDLQLDRTPVTVCLRSVLFAPADLPADRLLVRMQKEHKLLAVIQEQPSGRNLGICTVEDLLEELVGEIKDEFDAAKSARTPSEATPAARPAQ